MSRGSHLQGNVPAGEQWDTFIALASLIIWKKRRKKGIYFDALCDFYDSIDSWERLFDQRSCAPQTMILMIATQMMMIHQHTGMNAGRAIV